MTINRPTTKAFCWNARLVSICAAMRPDPTSQLTIFLAKPCGCTRKRSGFGRRAMMKRSFDGTHARVPSPEHTWSRVRSTIFDRYLNRRPLSKRCASGGALTLVTGLGKHFDHLLVEGRDVIWFPAR